MHHGKRGVREFALLAHTCDSHIHTIKINPYLFLLKFIEEEEAVEENVQAAELSNDSDAPLKPNVSSTRIYRVYLFIYLLIINDRLIPE